MENIRYIPYWRVLQDGMELVELECGAGERSRTPDLRITNALLYQLSYTGDERWCVFYRNPALNPESCAKLRSNLTNRLAIDITNRMAEKLPSQKNDVSR